jgi:multidrug resistance efflux pump
MLNITENRVEKWIDMSQFKSAKIFEDNNGYRMVKKTIWVLGLLLLVFLFLPWTQNVSGAGSVTTLKPNQRPQTVQSAIAGRIEKWYVNEGDYVKKGDTILFISEIKEDYLDPNLVENTGRQVDAKVSSASSYASKVKALENQIGAIDNERVLKFKQAQNKLIQAKLKVQSDSIDLEAVKTQLKIAKTQYNRSINLNKEGLKPLTDVEEKRVKLQDTEAKIITQENKYIAAQNEVLNAKIDLNRILAEYSEKVAKAQSDKQTALSSQFDTEAQVNKLKNQYQNYQIRNGMYYIVAPQNGYVNRALQSGIGETIKEGTSIVSIMPANFDIAVETYISPVDFPLIHKGEKVRVWFDGWPSIVFSGWPGASVGTFGGVVSNIDAVQSENGLFRVLVSPDPAEDRWPDQIKIGSGVYAWAMLDNVPVWYEICRQLNGFPPNLVPEVKTY